MCGLAGVKFLNGDLDVDCHEILLSLKHRGPDAQEYLRGDKYVLFHSRLSIIDLDIRSNQPFTDYSGRYSIVFNGEIYNFKELRASLDYPFRTESDTEVLLALLIAKGRNALKELDGMFAFAFFDNLEETCILARDIFGEKPLYYSIINDDLYFASEIRTLLKLSKSKGVVTRQQLSNWVRWQSIPGDGTLIENVFQVSPGSFLEFDAENRMLKHVFWDINNYRIQRFNNHVEVLDNLENLIYSAVNKRLESDVPFASFLSGGIDSSIISMIGSKILGTSMNTFTVGFNDDKFSEHNDARALANIFGTNHHEFILKPEFLIENLDDFFNDMDSPSADGMNTYIVSKLTKESGFKMALSGLGGDEWFMGYPNMNRLSRLDMIKYATMPDYIKKYLPRKYQKMLEILNSLKRFGGNAYPLYRAFFDTDFIVGSLNLPCPNLVPDLFKDDITHSLVSILEMEYYTTPILLKDSDQYSMANGLELRCPFMDRSLVEYTLGIDERIFKMSKSKYLLRSVFKNHIPEFVFRKKKMGFTFPWELWIRNELASFCEATLISFSARIGNDEILAKWKDFVAGKNDLTWAKFWGIVSIEQWIQRNNIEIK